MAHIKKNDKVKVLTGKDRGRQGKVLKVLAEKDSALVERLNMIKRHMKAGAKGAQQGGIVEKEGPIKLSRLMFVCPKCSKSSRTGIRITDDGSRVRFCKKCSEQVD